MTDYLKSLIAGLKTKTNLPVYYESVNTHCNPPCLTIYEVANIGNGRYDTYNRITKHNVVSYQIAIYGYDISDIIDYTEDVCEYMADNYWHKTGSMEMVNQDNGLIRKILTFQKYE